MAQPSLQEVGNIAALYGSLYSTFEPVTDNKSALLLAHYTSVQVVEQILRSNQIWFSNPLYMNDLEEMRAGVILGIELFPLHARVAAGGNTQRADQLIASYNHYLNVLATQHALDTYVFCLSKHEPNNTDGILSMWREYGSQGNGAALVFNTQKIHYQPHSPLLIVKVSYQSREQRRQTIDQILSGWAQITLTANLPDDHLYLAAHFAFDAVKSFGLVTKHTGFSEECEWRVVYVPDRDPLGYLKSCLDYFPGQRGVEPKLKYRFAETYTPETGKQGQSLTSGPLTDILEFILLGPTVSSPLAKQAFGRMLEKMQKSEFSDRVFSSSIPLRPRF